MRLKSKAAAVIVGATLLVAMSVATAFAVVAQQSVALQVGSDMGSGYAGTYGTEVVLTPAVMSKIELPGDKFHFQVLMQDVDTSGTPVPGMVWKDFRDFEDIALEDTNTVPPLSFRIGIDDSVVLTDGSIVSPVSPYQIRCEYKAWDSSLTTPAAGSTSPNTYSEIETVTVLAADAPKVKVTASKTVRRAGTYFSFQVSPATGVGTIRVTIARSGHTALTYTLVTDEDGYVKAKLKVGTKNGTYKVSAKFLGNAYAPASATASKTLHVAR